MFVSRTAVASLSAGLLCLSAHTPARAAEPAELELTLVAASGSAKAAARASARARMRLRERNCGPEVVMALSPRLGLDNRPIRGQPN